MKTSDLTVVSLVALVTAVIAVMLANAVPDAIAVEQQQKALVPGMLTVDGVELVLRVDAATSKPGKKPVLTVTAVNTGDQPVEMNTQIHMTSTSLGSMVSRRAPMPKNVWTESCYISLKPNETRTYELTAKAAVGKGSIVSFSMKAGGKTVTIPGSATLRRAARPRADRAKRATVRDVAQR